MLVARSKYIYSAIVVSLLILAAYGLYMRGHNSTHEIMLNGRDFISVSPTEISGVIENAPAVFTFMRSAFSGISWGISSDSEIVNDSILRKELSASITSGAVTRYDLRGISVETSYRQSKNLLLSPVGSQRNVKQLITLRNGESFSKTITFRTQSQLRARSVIWKGEEYQLSKAPIIFRGSADKSASSLNFQTADGEAVYDWSDVATWNHEVRVSLVGDTAVAELVLYDLVVSANGELVIDPNYKLSNVGNYDARYLGNSEAEELGAGVVVGDINGDGQDDIVAMKSAQGPYSGSVASALYIVFGAAYSGEYTIEGGASYNLRLDGEAGEEFGRLLISDVNGDGIGDLIAVSHKQGSSYSDARIWIVFSTLIDDVGVTTGNNWTLSAASSHNLLVSGFQGRNVVAGDINGDTKADLVVGDPWADNSGTGSGSVYLLFSTLIDDIGLTTGNTYNLLSSASYNIRYDGATEGDSLSGSNLILADDLSGDSLADLVFGASGADYDGPYTGSVYTIYSTLIDDVGLSTGNVKNLSTTSTFNIRYDSAGLDTYTISDSFGSLIADVNGDAENDLVMQIGVSSTTIILSNLVRASGGSTGNIFSLTNPANYNVRYLNSRGALAGDVNGDGLSDLILTTYGRVLVVFSILLDDTGLSTGNDFAVTDVNHFNIRFQAPSDFANWAAVADVNNDGFGDFLVNTPVNPGAISIIFSTRIDDVGATTGNLLSITTPANYNAVYTGAVWSDGFSMEPPASYLHIPPVALGDINGDGATDLIAGAAMADVNGLDSGAVYYIDSTKIDDVGVTTGNAIVLNPGAYTARFAGARKAPLLTAGGALATGDLNGDGIDDLVVGSPYAMNNGVTSGSAYIIFGGAAVSGDKNLSLATDYNIRLDGIGADTYLGIEKAIKIADVNGDGFGDLIIGCKNLDYGGTNTGSVFVLLSTLIDDVGLTTGNIWDLSLGTSYNIRYDGAVANHLLSENGSIVTGDVNGDGLSDLVLGAARAGYNGANSGSVWIIFSTLIDDVVASTGNVKSLSSAVNYNIRLDGAAAGNYFGFCSYVGPVASGCYDVGDVNGDGFGDLVISSTGADYGAGDSGSVWLLFSTLIDNVGLSTGNILNMSIAGSYNLRFDGITSISRLSHSAIGDVNGDGLGDLVLVNHSEAVQSSMWIIFSTLIDDVGSTTGNVKSILDLSTFNIRYDALDDFGEKNRVVIADVNGDNKSDLFQCLWGDVIVSFSTLIDDVGQSTGNVYQARSPDTFSARFYSLDSYGSGQACKPGSLGVADIDRDTKSDLLFGSNDWPSDNSYSGAMWVVSSTMLAAVADTRGNLFNLADDSNYSLRIDGSYGENLLGQYSLNGLSTNFLVGDLDNDGAADLLVGSEHSQENAGALYLIYGADYYTVSGQLLIDGQAVSGANVSFGDLGSVTSDANGNYVMTGLRSGLPYTITPTKTGHTFTPASSSGVLLADTVKNFSATAPKYSITGIITDSGNPVAGVTVDGGELGIVYSDSAGHYIFANIPVGTSYSIRPQRNNYSFVPDSKSGVLSANAAYSFEMSLESSAPIYRWGSAGDSVNRSTVKGLGVAPNGNLIACGEFDGVIDFDPGIGHDYVVAQAYDAVFMTTFSSAGSYLGMDHAGESQVGYNYTWLYNSDIAVSSSGVSYMAGWFDNNDAEFGIRTANDIVPIQGDNDGYLTKYNADGTYAWTKTIAAPAWDAVYINLLAAGSSDDIFVLGNYYGVADFDPGIGVADIDSLGGEWGFVAHYDNNGDFIAAGAIESDTYLEILDAKTDLLGNIYLTAYFEGIVDVDMGAGVDNRTAGVDGSTFLAKYDSALNLVWALSDVTVGYLSIAADGSIYVSGGYSGTVDFAPGPATDIHTASSGMEGYITRFASDGTYQWTKLFSESGNLWVRAMKVDMADNIYLAGGFSGAVNFNPSGTGYQRTAVGGDDLYLISFNSAGQFRFVQTLGGEGDEWVNDLAIDDNSGAMYLGGEFYGSFDANPGSGVEMLTSSGNGSHFIVKLDPPTLTYSLTGQVLVGGQPLSGVLVSAGGLGSAVTNGSGNFSIAGVSPGSNYTLTFSLAGYNFSPSAVSGTLSGNQTFSITAIPANYVVSGAVVTNTLSTRGLADVTVGNGTLSAVTDDAGQFAVSGLGSGSYEFHASKTGYREKVPLAVTLAGNSSGNIIRLNRALETTQYGGWNGYLGAINVLEVANSGDTPLGAELELYGEDGQTLSILHFSVPTAGQKDLILNDVAGFSADAYGMFRLSLSHQDFDGRVMVYRGASELGNYDFVYALPFANLLGNKSYVSFNGYNPSGSASNSEVLQWLAIENAGDSEARYNVATYAGDGMLLGQRVITVPAKGRRDIYGGAVSGPSERAGYHSIQPLTSGNRYNAVLVRYGAELVADSWKYHYALPFPAGTARSGMLSASAAAVAGRINWLELTNVLEHPLIVAMNLYSASGDNVHEEVVTIPAGSQRHLRLDTLFDGPADYGNVALTPDTEGGLLADSLFYFPGEGVSGIVAAYNVTADEVFGDHHISSVNSYLSQNNWLSVANLSDASQHVVITAAGNTLFGESQDVAASIVLPPHGTRILGVHPALDIRVPVNRYGRLEVDTETDGAILVELLRHRIGSDKGELVHDFTVATGGR